MIHIIGYTNEKEEAPPPLFHLYGGQSRIEIHHTVRSALVMSPTTVIKSYGHAFGMLIINVLYGMLIILVLYHPWHIGSHCAFYPRHYPTDRPLTT